MTDTINSNNGMAPDITQQTNELSGLSIKAQYIKDLSFENPTPIDHMTSGSEEQATTHLNVGVNVQQLAPSAFEVTLRIEAHLKRAEKTVYLAELDYAGIFALPEGLEELPRNILLFIECPRYLFPFARSIIADVTKDSGFPPIILQPLDFSELVSRHQQAEKTGSHNDSEENTAQGTDSDSGTSIIH